MIPQNSKAKHRYEVNNSTTGRRCEVPSLSYEDIKRIMEHRLAEQKRGILTKSEINHIIKDWEDHRLEENLDKSAIKHKVKRPEKRFKRYNIPEMGSIPTEKQKGRCRMLY